jgi:hypothetical protein
VEPLLGFVLLTLQAMPIATGVLDIVLSPTALALIEAVTVMAAAAVLEGTEDLAVRRAERAEGRHARSLPS